MPRVIPSLPSRLKRVLSGFGENIQKARLRREYSAELTAERAGISRKTLYRVEQGDPAVALGVYARVLLALRLDSDLEMLAKDDVLGRKLQDLNLETRKRAPRQKPETVPTNQESTTTSGKQKTDGKKINKGAK